MPQKYSRQLFNQLGEEAQLNAEEQWILQALAKIKHQRNSLQIERLHLESMKAKSKIDAMKQGVLTSAPGTPEPPFFDTSSLPSTSALDLMQNVSTTASRTVYGTPGMVLDGYCNGEELNLAVGRSSYGNNIMNTDLDPEEDDDDYEEDILIDMNMLMNGKHVSM